MSVKSATHSLLLKKKRSGCSLFSPPSSMNMDLPKTELTVSDIQTAWTVAQSSLKDWDAVKSSTSANEYGAYREMLSTATHGVEEILAVLEGQQSDLKRKVGAVKLLLRDIKRHDDIAKDRYWAIKRA